MINDYGYEKLVDFNVHLKKNHEYIIWKINKPCV